MARESLGYRYTWWRGDPLPSLAPLTAFQVERLEDVHLLAQLHQVNRRLLAERLDAGNRPYVAFLGGKPVAYGWSATQTERIGPDLAWPLAANERALWDFATGAAWRGQGIYPRLLQMILQTEAGEAEHFWIGHTPDNTASKRGILKAGFQPTAQILQTGNGEMRWLPQGERRRIVADPMVKHCNIPEEVA